MALSKRGKVTRDFEKMGNVAGDISTKLVSNKISLSIEFNCKNFKNSELLNHQVIMHS